MEEPLDIKDRLLEAKKEVNLSIGQRSSETKFIIVLQLNHLVMALVKVRMDATVWLVYAMVKVAVVAAAACTVAMPPKIMVIVLLVAVAVVMSMKNFLMLMLRQLPVISPFRHLRAYQKRDMQVMVLL